MPDCRGRVAAGKGDMGGTAANIMSATKSTCTLTSGSAVVTNVTTSNLVVGMRAQAAGYIADGTTIQSIDSANQLTLSAPATASGTPIVVRFGHILEETLVDRGGTRGNTLTTGQMPAHSHAGSTDSQGAHTHTVQGVGTGGTAFATSTGNTPAESTVMTSSAGAHTHNVTVGDTGGNQMHNNIQPSIIFNKIIKT